MTNWEELLQIEPRLGELEKEIRKIKRGRTFCANDCWYGYREYAGPDFKKQLKALVGWEAETYNTVLRSCAGCPIS
jgi:hypothetical protein